MTNKKNRRPAALVTRVSITAGIATSLLPVMPVQAQLTPTEINDLRNTIGNRIETMTILGGDYGVGGGSYSSSAKGDNANINTTKFGGSGEVGAPQPLGDLDIGWQPRVQGSMGYLTANNKFQSGLLDDDTSKYKTFAIQFGGGARFWLNDHFSIAPTVMGMYGHTENNFTAGNTFSQDNLTEAKQLGLIDWSVDTWTIRPSLNLQYQYTWHRVIFTLSSEPTYFYTKSFDSSSANLNVEGNAEAWDNKLDVDAPLGVELFGHELRTGGYFSRTDLYGDLEDGLATSYVYEAHGRLVLDFLNQLWKVQWIGLGGSYLWGNDFHGWSVGADVTFRF